MAVQGFAVLVNPGLNISFVKMGIKGVALGTAITYVVYSITLVIVGWNIMRRETDIKKIT